MCNVMEIIGVGFLCCYQGFLAHTQNVITFLPKSAAFTTFHFIKEQFLCTKSHKREWRRRNLSSTKMIEKTFNTCLKVYNSSRFVLACVKTFTLQQQTEKCCLYFNPVLTWILYHLTHQSKYLKHVKLLYIWTHFEEKHFIFSP